MGLQTKVISFHQLGMTRLQYTAAETMIYCRLYGGKDHRAHPTSRLRPCGVHVSGRRATLKAPPRGLRLGNFDRCTISGAGPPLPSLGQRGSDRCTTSPTPTRGYKDSSDVAGALTPSREGGTIDASSVRSPPLFRWSPSTFKEAVA